MPARAFAPPGVHYSINVRLDTARHLLDGWATIRYRSGADSALTSLWLHAYPNAFSDHRTVYGREAERCGENYEIRFAPPGDRSWMTLDSATVDGVPAPVSLHETLARVELPGSLASGDSISLRLHFRVQVPRPFDRFGRVGDSYAVAQWYPKMVVLDPEGWALDPYHFFAEFYGEFAAYDVSITLPDDQWVGATGTLVSAVGGDNEVPLEHAAPESVSVRLRVAAADPAAARRLNDGLSVEPVGGVPFRATLDSAAVWRVPRGAPLHYRYRAEDRDDGAEGSLLEADDEGRAGPFRFLIAASDTSVTDTLHAMVPEPADDDSATMSLKTLRFRAESVHDFAWVASPHYVGADTSWNGVAVRTLLFREDAKDWHGTLEVTVRALQHHSELVGPYVWPRFTSVEAMTSGGAMEYPMLIMNDPGLPDGELQWLDATIAHEAGHDWFYGMMGNDERRFAWLDEGFAQFLERSYMAEHYPRGIWKRRDRFRWVSPISLDAMADGIVLQRHYARDEMAPSAPAETARGYSQYSTAAYERPAVMLRSLQGVWGRETFHSFLHALYRRCLLRHTRPEDVYEAARETAGEDAPALLHPWIESTALPDAALGAVRRERTEGGWRTTVQVRRRGDLAFPVPVEARFDDGTSETKIVATTERENSVTFESRARLRRASIDPGRSVFDADRLNNRGGLLPPMTWRPLANFADPASITVLYGPTVWHGVEEGMRLGGWIEGRYLPGVDFPRGILSFEGGASVGARDGSVSWRAGYGRRIGALGARGSLRLLASRDAGLRRVEATISNWATGGGRTHPWKTWAFTVQDLDRSRLAAVDPSYWSAGRTLNAGASLRLDTQGPRRRESWILSWWHGRPVRGGSVANADGGYDRGSAEVGQTLDLGPRARVHVAWRAIAGAAWRRAPRERLFDGVEASRLETIERFYDNDRGPLRESGHYWTEGGGGLRGYAGRVVLGDRLLAGSLEARHDRWPISLFADAGRVRRARETASPGAPYVDRTLADAGIGFHAGMFHLYVPAWVGTPARGERPWDSRWIVAFDLPDLRYR